MTAPVLSAWTALCHHCDGIALGTTLEALDRAGALDRLLHGPVPTHALATELGLASGFMGLAGKLLRSQGLADQVDDALELTVSGRAVLREPRTFSGARERIGQAAMLLDSLIRGPNGDDLGDIDLVRLKAVGGTERWRQQMLGPLAAAAWFGLDRRGVLRALKNGHHRPTDAAEERAFEILQAVGWIDLDTDGHARATETGHAAADLAVQYAYPLCYLPTFASVPELLATGRRLPRVAGEETHVDRSLDIAFSGAVFSRSCREPFLKAALPLFDDPKISNQPVAIVDTGSGDGTVLASLFAAMRDRSVRGRMLDAHPLVLIGVEINEVARRATEERLAGLGTPTKSILGDIGKPKQIADALRGIGIDPARVLHVNKSVIHNRAYHQPARRYAAPETSAVFVGTGGESIAPDLLFSNLVEFFAEWAPFLGPHGMISIEAHTVPPERTAAHIGRNLITLLDAAHGYSCQYLVEIGFHRKAQDLAGIRRLSQTDLGGAMVGEPIMSVDHLSRS